jgi:hypothetical protein
MVDLVVVLPQQWRGTLALTLVAQLLSPTEQDCAKNVIERLYGSERQCATGSAGTRCLKPIANVEAWLHREK